MLSPNKVPIRVPSTVSLQDSEGLDENRNKTKNPED
jgi:hypothetical protein